jgi:hypothetical protein
VIVGSHPEFPMAVRSECRQEECAEEEDRSQALDPSAGSTTVGSRRTCTFLKVQGVEGSQNPERRRTVHLQAGHVDIDQHFADWRVKGTMFPNFSKSRYAESRLNLSRQIKV